MLKHTEESAFKVLTYKVDAKVLAHANDVFAVTHLEIAEVYADHLGISATARQLRRTLLELHLIYSKRVVKTGTVELSTSKLKEMKELSKKLADEIQYVKDEANRNGISKKQFTIGVIVTIAACIFSSAITYIASNRQISDLENKVDAISIKNREALEKSANLNPPLMKMNNAQMIKRKSKKNAKTVPPIAQPE